ncbi:MAG: amidohydrolase [Oscillospiraceae bacterium]|nr:amidohydrolase [Oscillospiraceae bacterium]
MKIYNAKIYTMTDNYGGIIHNGWIETKGSKIVNIQSGKPESIEGKDIINAQGGTIYPGFIDAHTHLGIIEDGIDFEGDDCNESSEPFTPHLRALDGINPFDRCFKEARQRGITTVASCPGSANPCGGEIAFIKTDGIFIDDMTLKNIKGIKFALGENPKRVYGDKSETPMTRLAITAIIREGLYKAKRYMNDYNAYVEDPENFDLPEYDMKCEALMPLLKKEAKAYFHCHRADDICTAIRIANEFDLDLVLIHCTEGYLVTDILKRFNIPVICGPVICDRCKPEMKGLNLKNAYELNKNNILSAVCTDHTVIPIQYLPLSAQACQKDGLSFIEALKSVTVNPALIMGADKSIGSLQIGMDADLQLYRRDQNPLDLLSQPKLVMINGKTIPLN